MPPPTTTKNMCDYLVSKNDLKHTPHTRATELAAEKSTTDGRTENVNREEEEEEGVRRRLAPWRMRRLWTYRISDA